ncbi:MAG: extracellular solute-binding protein [Actinomycetota bacterium]
MAARSGPAERSEARRGGRRRRLAAGAAVLALASVLAGCGESSDKPVLTWYINPDPTPPEDFEGAFGLAGIAERCSTDEYTIELEQLPTAATEQRIQLMRRLAANDDSIDLMSLDPVFTAEFSEAGYLAEFSKADQQELSQGKLEGAVEGASWKGELVVAPQWANTQLLWFRRSVAEEAGLDMSEPVTWDQVIDAAEETGTKVSVQGNKYEGYVVWLNALIQGAGGAIVTDLEKGEDMAVGLDSEAGVKAAEIVQRLAGSEAADADLPVSNEGTAESSFSGDDGGFMVNWTYIYLNYAEALEGDLGWARYPRTVEGEESKPPTGGINIGVGAFTDHKDQAVEAAKCITSTENQVIYATETGGMPTAEEAYDDADLQDLYPPEVLDLFRQSVDEGGPRPATQYWSTIVNAMLKEWHPQDSVTPETPAESGPFLEKVLDGDELV